MGRHCPDIANAVTDITDADFCYTTSSTKAECLKAIKKALKIDLSPKIILQENVIDANELKSYLMDNLKNIDVKVAIVGYVQRGGFATKKELVMATEFASKVAKCVKNGQYNKIICYKQQNNCFVAQDI